jgi:DNA-binding MarR family transcriptional regulator
MTQAPTLTGQDIAEAEGAVTKLLERVLAKVGSTGLEYVTLRVLAVRGPFASPKELHGFLAGQRQLGLSPAGVTELLAGLEARGLASGTALDDPGPARATPEGIALLAKLTEAVAPVTRDLFSGFDPGDLVAAHRVLARVAERAGRLSGQALRAYRYAR